jgi:hypothetical protein
MNARSQVGLAFVCDQGVWLILVSLRADARATLICSANPWVAVTERKRALGMPRSTQGPTWKRHVR